MPGSLCAFGERDTVRTGNKVPYLHIYLDHVKEICDDVMILGQEDRERGKATFGLDDQRKAF